MTNQSKKINPLRICIRSSLKLINKYKKIISSLLLALIFVFLIFYIKSHPEVIINLQNINPLTLLLLLILYLSVFVTQFVIMQITILICKKNLPLKTGLLLSIYSTLANFFGPLQSGPGVRAVYLKKKLGLKIRDYTFITLFYYFIFAAINISLLFMTTLPLATISGVVASVIFTIIGVKQLQARFNFKSNFKLSSKLISLIFIATTLQILFMTTIYYLELHVTNPSVNYTFLQTLVYSASANLSMFVAITPGAIGIREIFIVFTQSLHHIPLASVIAAGALDRAFYVLLLILLFVVSSGLHLKGLFGMGGKPRN
jgi:uncharacterized membrane protein YbhN (UPF0104 family)